MQIITEEITPAPYAHNYTPQVFKSLDGTLHMFRDYKPMSCPYQAPVISEEVNKLSGQVTIGYKHKGCGTWCPLFSVINDVEKTYVKLHCSDTLIQAAIEPMPTKQDLAKLGFDVNG